jgi:putative ABC transport system permease protein
VGIISGSYPAVMLSSLRPSRVQNDHLLRDAGGGWLRKSLVTAQFAITLLLVAGVFVVQQQLRYMQNRDLGFDREGLLMLGVNGSREVIANYAAFANEVRLIPGVAGVARSNTVLAGGLGNSVATMSDHTGKDRDATVYRLRTDFDYLDVYGMRLAAGRFFDEANAADSTGAFVVNEALARFFGYATPEEALGRKFVFQGREGKVIGVIRDFHYHSLQHKIEPTCLYLLRQNFSQIGIQLDGDVGMLRARVEEVWRKHFPNTLLDSSFADEALNRQYSSERRLSTLVLVFSGLSLVIACLGLLALVSFAVECRTKEIGIRKVLGASVRNIVSLLTREFVLLILAAALVALPAGYYLLNQWLAGFAYHMELNPVSFILATATVVLVAGATLSARSMKAASSNPVKALRNE